jgi:hypothetical protein
MREVSSCAPPESSAPAPPTDRNAAPEQLRRQAVADLLAEARCPICHYRLRYHMTCRGPIFVCLCDDKRPM